MAVLNCETDTIASGIQNTTTQQLGVTLEPRLPKFEFNDLPPVHSKNLAITVFNNMFGIVASEVEKVFIRTGGMMGGIIENEHYRSELANFVAQEAIHSRMHAKMNKELIKQGQPVQEISEFIAQTTERLIKHGGERHFMGMTVAGEQIFGAVGEGMLINAETIEEFHPSVASLLLWHGYEEMEHSASIYDSLLAVMPDKKSAYQLRRWTIPFVIVSVSAFLLPPVFVYFQHMGKGQGFRLRNWKSYFGYLFGKHGIMKEAGTQLLAYMKRDYHPWDYHQNDTSRLEKYKKYARDEWKVSKRTLNFDESAGAALRQEIETKPGFFRDLYSFTKYTASVSKLTFGFLRKAHKENYWRDRVDVSYETTAA